MAKKNPNTPSTEQKPPEPPLPPRPRKEMVFAGLDFSSYVEPCERWYVLGSDKLIDVEHDKANAYTLERGKGMVPHASPGAVYSFEYNPETPTSIYPGTARYIGRYSDEDAVIRWQTRDRTERTLMQAAKLEESDNAKRYDLERLKPFQETYFSMPSMQRAIYLAMIVRYITGFSKAKKK